MDRLANLLYKKPFIAVLPPGIGTGISFIPEHLTLSILNVMDVVDGMFPFFRLVLMLATLLTTILAIKIQIQKLKVNKPVKKDD